MRIEGVVWLPEVVDKLIWKHHVAQQEVEEVFFSHPLFRKVQKGHVPGEDLYSALGRTEAGRYIAVFFIFKVTKEALVISARDMDKRERRRYEQR